MDVSLLVPWRSKDPQRIKIWEYCKSLWEDKGVEICEGQDAEDGPFNTAKACNAAFRKSTKPWLITMGADVIPGHDLLKLAFRRIGLANSIRWMPLGDRTEYFNSETTDRILQTGRWEPEETDPQYSVPFQTGIMLIHRNLYLETGGHDERFTGWGGEDAAFRRVVHLLGGDSDPVPLTLRCLWHDPGRRGTMSATNFSLCKIYDDMSSRQQCLDYLSTRGSFLNV